jgi:hypothetical protein
METTENYRIPVGSNPISKLGYKDTLIPLKGKNSTKESRKKKGNLFSLP